MGSSYGFLWALLRSMPVGSVCRLQRRVAGRNVRVSGRSWLGTRDVVVSSVCCSRCRWGDKMAGWQVDESMLDHGCCLVVSLFAGRGVARKGEWQAAKSTPRRGPSLRLHGLSWPLRGLAVCPLVVPCLPSTVEVSPPRGNGRQRRWFVHHPSRAPVRPASGERKPSARWGAASRRRRRRAASGPRANEESVCPVVLGSYP